MRPRGRASSSLQGKSKCFCPASAQSPNARGSEPGADRPPPDVCPRAPTLLTLLSPVLLVWALVAEVAPGARFHRPSCLGPCGHPRTAHPAPCILFLSLQKSLKSSYLGFFSASKGLVPVCRDYGFPVAGRAYMCSKCQNRQVLARGRLRLAVPSCCVFRRDRPGDGGSERSAPGFSRMARPA
jgi:hypothetical protein